MKKFAKWWFFGKGDSLIGYIAAMLRSGLTLGGSVAIIGISIGQPVIAIFGGPASFWFGLWLPIVKVSGEAMFPY